MTYNFSGKGLDTTLQEDLLSYVGKIISGVKQIDLASLEGFAGHSNICGAGVNSVNVYNS